ncbi:hypothetical protein IV454_21065 [Massilia antarctica]|uniref:Uncharacterized protein n=1 Tax=Massilia antarctica TaxID=2765360 RepID=A0AA49A637_9BURK|nr:hypothetical protein [Massilia antarctica]QPI48033.1 hypothetical protein IV454_21065 [Massilia antarctica]
MNVDLLVQIDRFVDDYFPGWVECSLLDADGNRHVFVEKAPVVSADHLRPDSAYPQPCTIRCMLEEEWTDPRGRRAARIDTGLPWSIESIAGQSRFVVLAEQIVPWSG